MSVRELEILIRELRGKDYTLLRSDYSLYQRDLVRDGQKFLKSLQDTAKKEKRNNIILVGITWE